MLENIINTCKRVARALHMLVILVSNKVYFVIFFFARKVDPISGGAILHIQTFISIIFSSRC